MRKQWKKRTCVYVLASLLLLSGCGKSSGDAPATAGDASKNTAVTTEAEDRKSTTEQQKDKKKSP